MCKRNTADPLVRTFLDTYGLNLLAIPRADAHVGDLYVVSNRAVSVPGALAHVLTPPFTLPPVTEAETLADVAGKMSGRIEAKASLGLLEGFFVAIGAALVVGKVKAGYESKRASTLRFRLSSATRDSVDPLEFGAALIGHTLNEQHPFIQPGNRYLVTTAVVRTRSLTVVAENESANAVDLGAEVLKTVDGAAGLAARRTAQGEITYDGKRAVAIGVELHELIYDSSRQKFSMEVSREAVRVRSVNARRRESDPSFIGDEKAGDAFIGFGP